MAARKSKGFYYYAGGKRVPMRPAQDLVAVDEIVVQKEQPELLASDPALHAGQLLRSGIRLLRREDLASGTLQALQDAGATQPVFRQGKAILIALPEVRVEDESEAKLAKARTFAAAKTEPIGEAADGHLTLQPLSHDGGDAVALANELVEQYELSASPRFLRVVPGPGART